MFRFISFSFFTGLLAKNIDKHKKMEGTHLSYGMLGILLSLDGLRVLVPLLFGLCVISGGWLVYCNLYVEDVEGLFWLGPWAAFLPLLMGIRCILISFV